MNTFFRKSALVGLVSFLLIGSAAPVPAAAESFAGKKILYINSYHVGYEWSDAVEKGVHSVIDPSKAELRVVYMDTKNHQDEEFKKKAGLDAKAVIDEWKPDVVITSDDNAVHYVIVPYFKDTKIPIVFNGVNWDAEQYGFPCSNVTGMVEVNSVDQLLKLLKSLRPNASRVAVLAADTETERQELKNHRKILGIDYVEEVYASTFEDWKKNFLELQDKADVLQLQNNAGIKGWNNEEAKAFVLANTKIPTGAIDGYMAPFSTVVFAKIPEEQGEWAAKAALEILGGKKPSDIPLGRNVRGQVFVNAPLARKLDVKIPEDVLAVAVIAK